VTIAVRPLDAARAAVEPRASPGAWLGFALFFLMLAVPTSYQPVKAVLLGALVAGIAVCALAGGRIRLHPSVILWTVFLVTVGLIFMLRGFAGAAPGALRVGTVYGLWPVAYLVLVAGASSEPVLQGLLRTLVVATVAIGLYGLSYILHTAGWLPGFLYLPIDLGQGIGLYRGYIEVNLYNLASLLFLIPFVVAGLMTWPSSVALPLRRAWLWVALLAGGALALLSGRRALLLVIALAPGFVLLFRLALPRSLRKAGQVPLLQFVAGVIVAGGALLLLLHAIYGFRLEFVWRMFLQGFDFGRDVNATARSAQFEALLHEWAAAPLFGAGHGASAAGSVRSTAMPWAYELSYAALLFHTGLVGFLAYAAGVVWIFASGVCVIRQGGPYGLVTLALLVGLSCFLIGNATNPYLEKYDLLWVIFLPAAFINHWLLTGPPDATRPKAGAG
jgi:hypothetical protein